MSTTPTNPPVIFSNLSNPTSPFVTVAAQAIVDRQILSRRGGSKKKKRRSLLYACACHSRKWMSDAERTSSSLFFANPRMVRTAQLSTTHFWTIFAVNLASWGFSRRGGHNAVWLRFAVLKTSTQLHVAARRYGKDCFSANEY